MTRVFQTEFGPNGNCYAASLASILELSLDAVPDLRRFGQTWTRELRQWLAAYSVNVMFTPGDEKPLREQRTPPAGWAILGHRTINGYVHSAVCRDGRLIHDPSPRPYCGPDVRVLLWTVFKAGRLDNVKADHRAVAAHAALLLTV